MEKKRLNLKPKELDEVAKLSDGAATQKNLFSGLIS
jgi:hypothetical protein